MVRVYYYETGSQQRKPLYVYEGGTFGEAQEYLEKKLGHKRTIKQGFYQLVTFNKLEEMKALIANTSDQWYIIFDHEV